MFSFAGDTVVDPFGGTGSTAMAAICTGRNSVSIDIEPSYVDQMGTRLKMAHPAAIVHIDRNRSRRQDAVVSQICSEYD
jgi:DNA modification methylase